MKTAKIKLYTAEELKELSPEAYEKAKSDYENFEADYSTDDEGFIEISDANGYFYTADGELFGGRLESLCEAE